MKTGTVITYPLDGKHGTSNCVWNLKPGTHTGTTAINLNFVKFEIPQSTNCATSYLMVEDNGVLVGKYCGSTKPVVTSTTGNLRLTYHHAATNKTTSVFSVLVGKW